MKLLLTKLPNGGWVIYDANKQGPNFDHVTIGAYSNAADMMDGLWELVKPEPVQVDAGNKADQDKDGRLIRFGLGNFAIVQSAPLPVR